jgi:putative PIN family toxin of toxin-antitoxin system
MIRVVIDTNIIVSALLQPLGPPAQVFFLAISGSIQLSISGNVYAEYEEVIRRPRLRRDESVVTATLHTIREKALWVRPTESIRACADADAGMRASCTSGVFGDWQHQGLSCFMARHPDCHGAVLSWKSCRAKPKNLRHSVSVR